MSDDPEKIIEKFMKDIQKMFGFKTDSPNNSNSPKNEKQEGYFSPKLQMIIIVSVVVFYGLVTSFYKIETSQQGVVTRFGAFSHITEEGPHFKIPFGVDTVYRIEVTRIHELQFGFRSDGKLDDQQARQESLMLTGDLNVAIVEWILQFKISDPKKFLFHAANVEKNVRDISMSVMRRVVGDKLVSDVFTTDRVQISHVAHKLTQEVLDTYDMGILITKIHLQNVTPPEPVKPAFNEINIARQESEEMINKAKGTYNKVIPEAKGKAEKVIAEAQAYAIQLINKAKGDSDKFKQVLVAYKRAPQITRDRMYLETIEEVLSNAENFTIVDPRVQGLLPIYNTLKKAEKTDDAEQHGATVSQNEAASSSQAPAQASTQSTQAQVSTQVSTQVSAQASSQGSQRASQNAGGRNSSQSPLQEEFAEQANHSSLSRGSKE